MYERMGCCGEPIGFPHSVYCEDVDFEEWREHQDRLAAEYEADMEQAHG